MDYFDKEEIEEPELLSNNLDMDIKENNVSIDENKEIPAETVEITNYKSIIPYLEPQESKYWHFKFNDVANQERLTKLLETIPEYKLTVDYGIPQNTPDITLKMNDKIVGKIHLLLCDRRDANIPEKYYCKLYFYHFKNKKLFDTIKSMLVKFFENINKPTKQQKGGKSKNKRYRTIKRRKHILRKKTNKRS
jgi:hypothetical protein